MIHFVFSNKVKNYLFLKGDNDQDDFFLKQLHCNMCIVNPICYLKTYTGPKYTEDYMFEYTQPSGKKIYYTPIGNWKYCYDFFKENNIEFDGLLENVSLFKTKIKHSFDEFVDIIKSWNLSLSPRPYQYEAAYKILQWKQSLSLLSTRAGKTLIAYIVFRYAMQYLNVKNILVIVPSIDLVKQMYNDFNEYKEFFKTECIWAGGKLVESSNITVGTFQSLIKFIEKPTLKKPNKKYNPDFFKKYNCIFVDEVHRATARQIKTIIECLYHNDLKFAFGMSGTLPKLETIEYFTLHSLLGAKIQSIKPKQLMDDGYISPIEINQIRLNYISDKEKIQDLYIQCAEYSLSDYSYQNDKGVNKKIKLDNPKFLLKYKKTLPPILSDIKLNYNKHDYIDYIKSVIPNSTKTNLLMIEKMVSHFMESRIDYLCKYILPLCDKNTLILAHHTEYIHYFSNIVKEKFPNRNVLVITGNVNSKTRDKIKQTLKENNNCILIASYGTMSTGITLSNLCYGVLFESFKSEVVNMQSLGRGLGLSDLKSKYIVYDIIDNYKDCGLTNKIYLQGLSKIKLYKENNYKYKIININL